MVPWIAVLNKPSADQRVRQLPRLARDIFWAVASPPLICDPQDPRFPKPDWFTQQAESLIAPLEQLSADPRALQAFSEHATALRLGGYFEELLLWWIKQSPQYELLSHNQQIHIDGITAGAFDFILRDLNDGVIEHWEVACKFYIRDGAGDQLSDWFGPARNDRFDRKFGHLLSHQIALSENAGKDWLDSQGWPIGRQKIIIKGRLYADFDENPTLPDICNPELLRGWVKCDKDWNRSQPHTALQRHQWLSPVIGQDLEHRDADKAVRHGCLCAAVLDDECEVSRGFIIPDDWYEQTPQMRR